MVNCHLLNQELCQVIYDKINDPAKSSVIKYGLAFFFNEEEKNCRIKAYLDRYLTRNFEINDKKSLRKYICEHILSPVLPECKLAKDPERLLLFNLPFCGITIYFFS